MSKKKAIIDMSKDHWYGIGYLKLIHTFTQLRILYKLNAFLVNLVNSSLSIWLHVFKKF